MLMIIKQVCGEGHAMPPGDSDVIETSSQSWTPNEWKAWNARTWLQIFRVFKVFSIS